MKLFRRLPPIAKASLIGAPFGLFVLCLDSTPLTFVPLIWLYMLLGCKTASSVAATHYRIGLPILHLAFGATVGASFWTVFGRLRAPRPQVSLLAGNALRHLLGLIAIVVAFPIACGLLFCYLLPPGATCPSDEVYIATFPRNRAALDELVSLLKGDNRLAESRFDPEREVDCDGTKLARYLELLKSLGAIQAKISSTGTIEVRDSEDLGLMAIADDEVSGYCYAPPASEPVLKSLNGLKTASCARCHTVRPITGKWYVYYAPKD